MRRRAFGLRPVPTSLSRPFGFNPSRLRACGAARFACLRGIGARPIPAAQAWRPSIPPNRLRRIGRPAPRCNGRGLANTLELAAAGCANRCRPQRWRFSPITSRRTVHGHPARHRHGASTPRLKTSAARCGRGVLARRWGVDLARAWGEPVQPSCGDAEPALPPVGAVRPKASLCCC